MARALISARTMRTLRALDASAMPDEGTLVRPGAEVSNGRGGVTKGADTTRAIVGRFAEGTGDGVGQQEPLEDEEGELRRRGATARYNVAVGEDVVETDELYLFGLRYGVVYTPPPAAYSSSRLVGLKLLGPAPLLAASALLTEDGDTLITEAGDRLILEAA